MQQLQNYAQRYDAKFVEMSNPEMTFQECFENCHDVDEMAVFSGAFRDE